MPLHRIADRCPHSLGHLADQTQTLPWNDYLDLVSKSGTLFGDDGLREIGRRSWHSPTLKIRASIGKFMATPHSQYESIYGSGGYCESNFPIHAHVEKVSRTNIDIRLKARGSLRCNTAFFLIMAGQMEGLTKAIGLPTASVTVYLSDDCAHFSIVMQKMSLRDILLRRIGQWFSRPDRVVGELSHIQDQLEALAMEHQRSHLQRESSIRPLTKRLRCHELIEEQIPGISWTMNPDGEADFIGTTTRLLGYEAGEQGLTELLGLEAVTKLADRVSSVIRQPPGTDDATSNTSDLILDAKHNMGHVIRLLVRIHPGQTSGDGEEGYAICTATEISQRPPESMDEQILQLQAIRDLSVDGIITVDKEGHIIDANQSACHLFAYLLPELIGTHITSLLPDALADSQLGIRKNRALVPVQVATSKTLPNDRASYVYIVRDMTSAADLKNEKAALEQQLQASQKSDAIGRMTSGIAHDFNNLVAAILGLTDRAEQSVSPHNSQLLAQLADIRKTGQRGQDMIRQLLNFSRQNTTEFQAVDVNSVIRDTLRMLSGLLTDAIKVETDIEEEPVYLMANHTQIEQVLVNLVVNARDAMPGGGVLYINTSSNPDNHGPATQFTLEVRDTGTGMDQQTREKIFEPLFTSKPEGRGTGLGLSVVSTIVEQHGGQINVQTEPGTGTNFQVILPITTAQDEPQSGSDQLKKTRLAT